MRLPRERLILGGMAVIALMGAATYLVVGGRFAAEPREGGGQEPVPLECEFPAALPCLDQVLRLDVPLPGTEVALRY